MQQELNLGLEKLPKFKFKMKDLTKRERQAVMLAWAAADTSEDPYVQTGACAIRCDKSVCGVGYNGPPPGVEIDWSDRDGRREYMVHAEPNALAYAKPGECNIVGITLFPCKNCLNTMARYGIKTVVFINFYDIKSGYGQYEDIFLMAEKYGIQLKQAVDFNNYIKNKLK